MPQIFVDTIDAESVTLRGAEARHIATVLRLGVGDRLVICDGRGGRYMAEIAGVRPLNVTVRVLEPLPPIHFPAEITLAAGVIRPERFEWLIEKVFELGCRRLIPLLTERTATKYLPKQPEAKLTRWREIALAAAKQSGLPWTPEVAEITPVATVLAGAQGTIYYCWEGLARVSKSPGGVSLPGILPQIPTILIGPEGGFTPREHDEIMSHHPELLSLGPLILRAETAAITALTLVQHRYRYFTPE